MELQVFVFFQNAQFISKNIEYELMSDRAICEKNHEKYAKNTEKKLNNIEITDNSCIFSWKLLYVHNFISNFAPANKKSPLTPALPPWRWKGGRMVKSHLFFTIQITKNVLQFT